MLANTTCCVYTCALIYFDHNATSPLCAVAQQTWLNACQNYPANPASPHRLGGRAEAALENARLQLAEWLGCSPLDLVWTSGATEANNSLFHHCSLDTSGEAWVSAIEHPSALEAARKWFGPRLKLIPVEPSGVVDLTWLSDQLKQKRPSLVAIMAANNETGVLQPWREALHLCRDRETPFACDAAQWIGKMDANGLGECDFVTGCAHKFGGPLGIGFIKVTPAFRPLLIGGEQEHGRRAGTQNLPSILALAAAWELRNRQLAGGETVSRIAWRDRFIERLKSEVTGLEVVGSSASRLWNTVSVLMPPSEDCRKRWIVKLDKHGFAVSTGSACASGKAAPSHVLTAMGCDPAEADRMLRFSAGWETTADEWDALCETILKLACS